MIQRQDIEISPTDSLRRIWDDVGLSTTWMVESGGLPCPELVDVADLVFDELIERSEPIPHYEELEALLGIIEVSECPE